MTSMTTTATLLTIGKGLLRELKAAAAAPSGPIGGWELLGTYHILSGPDGNGVFRVAIPADNPLRLRHGDTELVVPYAEMDTDFGSIPKWCKAIAESLHLSSLHLLPGAYPRSTLLHDAFYAAAWCWAVRDNHAVRVDLPRAAADAALMIALKCELATRADVLAYSAAVKRHGGTAWQAHRKFPPDFPPLFTTQTPEPQEQP